MSDSKKTFNFGILGCGMIAEIHAKAIASIDCAELIGVTDNAADRAMIFAEKYGVECYQSYESMLSDPRIDAVCICTPSCFHAENAIKAMEKGKHVAVEKPMAIDLKGADEVVAVSRRTGKYLTVISQLRFADEIVKVKKMIDENAFGRITLCSLSMKYYRSPEYYSSSSWKGTKKFDGGGALMNQGIHGIDLLQYLVGPMTNVNGVAKTLCHNIEVEDTAVATFELENGALGVLEASTCTYPGFSRRIEIHGERGYVSLLENNIERLMIDCNEVDVSSVSHGGTAFDPTALESDLHAKQLSSFIESIEKKTKIISDSCDGRKAVEVVERIYKFSEQ